MDFGDFIFLNHKINQNAYELAKNENKRLVHLCTGDVPPLILPNDKQIIVLNTNILWTKHIIPPSDIIDDFSHFLENPELSISFVGQMNNEQEKICQYFSDSGLKTNFIFCLQDNHRINGNLFTLCYRDCFYETLMRGRIPIQINSSSIFPYEDEIDYSDVGIFIEEENLDKVDLEKLVKDYYNSKSADELLQIQKNNRRIYKEYFHPDVYFSQIFREALFTLPLLHMFATFNWK